MKQLIFLLAVTTVGSFSAIFINPFWGVLVYYFFAVLRPQFIWAWALGEYKDLRYSFAIALSTIFGTLLHTLGFLGKPSEEARAAPKPFGAYLSHLAFFSFAFWIFLTYVTARSQELAEPWFIEYLKIFVMFLVASLVLRTVRELWMIFVVTGMSLAFIAYEINYAYLRFGKVPIYHTGYGGLDNNGAGLMLAMGIPICFFIWEGMLSRWRWIFLPAILVLLHAVLMSYSRGAMLSLAVTFPLTIWRSRNRFRLLLVTALVGVVVLPVMAGPEIRARFFSLEGYEKDKSAQSRFGSWRAAWNIACDNPLLGVGVRNSNAFSFEYGADLVGRTIHSQYLQVLADNGFIGLGLYLLAFFIGWIALMRARRFYSASDDRESRQAKALASGVECSLAVFCFGAIFLSLEVFELPYLLLLLADQLLVVSYNRPLAAREESAYLEFDETAQHYPALGLQPTHDGA